MVKRRVAVCAPSNGAISQCHVGRIAEQETAGGELRHLVGRFRAEILPTGGEINSLVDFYRNPIELDAVNFSGLFGVNHYSVFATANDIRKANVVNCADATIGIPRYVRNVNGLAATPPAIVVHAGFDDAIGKQDMLDAAFETKTDAQATVRLFDNAESTTTSRIGEVTSQPTMTAPDRVVRLQPVMMTFSHGLSTPQLSGDALREMQSSPERMSQFVMRTLDERSTSMPSLLGISISLSM